MFSVTKTIYWISVVISAISLVASQRNVPSTATSIETLDVLMKGAKPKKHDEYLCSAYKMPVTEHYIVQFEALADAGTAHHILLFGCDEPASTQSSWHCGRLCNDQEQILFAWAKNAPPLKLPKDVGFKVGGATKLKYIVIQVHYVNPLPANVLSDNSGIRLFLTSQRQRYEAGIYLLLAYSVTIPGNTVKTHADISCKFVATGPIYPFGFRTHAHALGQVISGYIVNSGRYEKIGKGNPQWPQAFYPVEKKLVIDNKNTFLVGRCTYNSTGRSRTTYIGSTANDEMCNFYIMYYAEPTTRINGHTCAGNNVPSLIQTIPADSDEPLPPNPLLEMAAHGHHGLMGDPKGHDGSGVTEGTTGNKPLQTTPGVPEEVTHMVDFESDFGSAGAGVPTAGSDVVIGQVGGVATDNQGNVYVFHRGNRVWDGTSFNTRDEFQYQNQPIRANCIIVYDKEGKVARTFGKNMFYMPHGITVDRNNNIWVTDVALHQVMRFPPNSNKPDIILGEKFKPGKDDSHFCKPSDVAVLKSGKFYVSDGYCNSRIMIFDSQGNYLSEFGSSKNALLDDGFPAEGSLDVPHSLALAEEKGLLCVADRENGRIQCFDLQGNFQKQMHPPEFGSRLFAVAYCKMHGGLLFAVNGPSYTKKVQVQGFILDINTGELIETWNAQPGLQNPHDIEVDPINLRVYVGELDPTKVWRFDMKADNSTGGSLIPSYTQAPVVVGTTNNYTMNDNKEETKKTVIEDETVLPAIIIGALLVIPVIIIIIIVVVIRVYRKGKYHCCQQHRPRSGKKFNLGNFLTSHRGFDRLSQEESENDLDSLDDSDIEEYSISRKA